MGEEAVNRYRRKLAILRGDPIPCETCKGTGVTEDTVYMYGHPYTAPCPVCRPTPVPSADDYLCIRSAAT